MQQHEVLPATDARAHTAARRVWCLCVCPRGSSGRDDGDNNSWRAKADRKVARVQAPVPSSCRDTCVVSSASCTSVRTQYTCTSTSGHCKDMRTPSASHTLQHATKRRCHRAVVTRASSRVLRARQCVLSTRVRVRQDIARTCAHRQRATRCNTQPRPGLVHRYFPLPVYILLKSVQL